MDARLAELRADRFFFERVETGLLPRDLDPLRRKEREESVLHALGRIFFERFMQNPGVIPVDVKSELLIATHRAGIGRGDSVHDTLKILHVCRVAFPGRVPYAARCNIFFQEPIVSVGKRVRGTDDIRWGKRDRRQEKQ